MYVCMVITYIWINRVRVTNPARGQLNRNKMNIPLFPYVPENLVS